MTKRKLVRTLLSRKPDPKAALTSLASLALLVLFFTVYQEDAWGLSRFLSADFTQVFRDGELWRAFTAPLVHADVEHLGSNLFFFVGLGYLLRGYFGFWAFPVLSFIAGGVINLLVLPVYPPETVVLGASGIVYFMAAFWVTLYFGIERGIPKAKRLMNTSAFAGVLLVPQALHPQVSYLSHSIGFVLGIAFGALFFAAKRGEIRMHELWVEEADGCADPESQCPVNMTA